MRQKKVYDIFMSEHEYNVSKTFNVTCFCNKIYFNEYIDLVESDIQDS